MEYVAIIERAADGSYSAYVPDLPGCVSCGDTVEEVRTLMDTVARFVQLVDRKTGTFVGIVFCEAEDEMRRADEALNRMSPGAGGGSRTSADVYEVAIDQSFR